MSHDTPSQVIEIAKKKGDMRTCKQRESLTKKYIQSMQSTNDKVSSFLLQCRRR